MPKNKNAETKAKEKREKGHQPGAGPVHPSKTHAGRAGFTYQMPGSDEPQTFRNPSDLQKAIREESDQDPDEFAKEQGFNDFDALLADARGKAAGEDDDEEDEDEGSEEENS